VVLFFSILKYEQHRRKKFTFVISCPDELLLFLVFPYFSFLCRALD